MSFSRRMVGYAFCLQTHLITLIIIIIAIISDVDAA